MLHETLFALLGHTGSVIVEVSQADQQIELTKQLLNESL